jgi:hypothetical protein
MRFMLAVVEEGDEDYVHLSNLSSVCFIPHKVMKAAIYVGSGWSNEMVGRNDEKKPLAGVARAVNSFFHKTLAQWRKEVREVFCSTQSKHKS